MYTFQQIRIWYKVILIWMAVHESRLERGYLKKKMLGPFVVPYIGAPQMPSYQLSLAKKILSEGRPPGTRWITQCHPLWAKPNRGYVTFVYKVVIVLFLTVVVWLYSFLKWGKSILRISLRVPETTRFYDLYWSLTFLNYFRRSYHSIYLLRCVHGYFHWGCKSELFFVLIFRLHVRSVLRIRNSFFPAVFTFFIRSTHPFFLLRFFFMFQFFSSSATFLSFNFLALAWVAKQRMYVSTKSVLFKSFSDSVSDTIFLWRVLVCSVVVSSFFPSFLYVTDDWIVICNSLTLLLCKMG